MSDELPASSAPVDRARSFGSVARAYDRGRPSYPADAAAWLAGGEAKVVLELAAGTGKLTRELVDQGHAVFATEPDEAMLASSLEAARAQLGEEFETLVADGRRLSVGDMVDLALRAG